jgi:hypothetical protein
MDSSGATPELQESYYTRPVSATISSDNAYWELVPHILNADASGVLPRYDYRLTGDTVYHIRIGRNTMSLPFSVSRHGRQHRHCSFHGVHPQTDSPVTVPKMSSSSSHRQPMRCGKTSRI